MVSRRTGNNAFGFFLIRETADLVIRTSELKRAGHLQIFCLDIDILSNCRGIIERGHTGYAGQHVPGVLNHFHGQHTVSLPYSYSTYIQNSKRKYRRQEALLLKMSL